MNCFWKKWIFSWMMSPIRSKCGHNWCCFKYFHNTNSHLLSWSMLLIYWSWFHMILLVTVKRRRSRIRKFPLYLFQNYSRDVYILQHTLTLTSKYDYDYCFWNLCWWFLMLFFPEEKLFFIFYLFHWLFTINSKLIDEFKSKKNSYNKLSMGILIPYK